jgi:hypothetical protein
VNCECTVPDSSRADLRTYHGELEPLPTPKFSVGQWSDENGAGISELHESKSCESKNETYERRVRKIGLQVSRQILLERTNVVERNLTPLAIMWRI